MKAQQTGQNEKPRSHHWLRGFLSGEQVICLYRPLHQKRYVMPTPNPLALLSYLAL